MKKLIQIIVALALMALAFQFIINLLISKHDITYSIITEENNYTINEIFSRVEDDHLYSFKVTDKDNNNYLFSYTKDFNKQEKVITDIEYYKSNNLKCIFPIYKRNNTNILSCKINKQQVSYSYLKQTNNPDITIIENELLNKKYKISNWNKTSNTATTDNKISVYKENIPDNYYFTSWNYKGIHIINNKEVTNKELLEYDSYENKFSALVKKYYVTFNTDSSANEYNEVYTYNIKDGGKAVLELESPTSKNIYINGVYKNKLYVTDIDNKKQLSISPLKAQIKEVGNKNDGFKYLENNQLKTKKSQEFLSTQHTFNKTSTNKKIIEKYNPQEIKEYNNNYYYRDINNNFYEIVDTKINHPILLFNLSNIKDWYVKESAIVVISNDTVYMYTNNYGLKPIIKNPELIYNYKNIIDFVEF